MWFSQTVRTVGIFVTFCIGLAVIANAGEDLARGIFLSVPEKHFLPVAPALPAIV